MEPMRKQEIKSKAKDINNLSEQFQLIHATYAVQECIKNIVKEVYTEKLNALTVRMIEKMQRDLNTDDELREKQELEDLIKRNRVSIDIGYIDISDDNIARVVKVGNSSFHIYLALSLRNSLFMEDGEYNYETITKIRQLMSHELGHLVLHTKDLLLEDGTQGSLTIRDSEKEEEADLFGEELLQLRKERNRKIRCDGGAENLF